MSYFRNALLYPRSVALIGASADVSRLTARPLKFMRHHGFQGEIFPVNVSHDTVGGLKAYKSVADIPAQIDHAYILLNADPALEAVEACAAVGVPVVTVLADGFAESGGAGIERQKRLIEIAENNKIKVIGPNSTGVVQADSGFSCTTNAAFGREHLPTGNFAVLSQSGSVIGAMLSRSAAVGLGFKAYVSVGNEACLGVGEIGKELVSDPEIDGFILFLETIRRPDEVKEFAALAHAAGKPLIAYLVGKSDAGQSLAASHTGAMTGGGKAIRAFLDGLGIYQVDNFEALAELANMLKLRERLKTRPDRATVLTTTGGGGGMVYDLLGMRGVELTGMSQHSSKILNESGLFIKPGALVDVTLAGAKYETMKSVVSALINDPASGLVVAVIGSSAQFNPELAVKPIVDAVKEAGANAAPVVAVPVPDAAESIRMFNESGIPAFRTAESAAECIGVLLSSAPGYSPRQVDDTALSGVRQILRDCVQSQLLETEAAAVFRELSIKAPPSIAIASDGPVPDEMPFDGPYVVKVLSREIQHKSDIGGVVIGLSDVTSVTEAVTNMRQALAHSTQGVSIIGYLIQQQVSSLGEAIIGFYRDPVVGPLITVGMGGVSTEIYEDLAVRPAPVSVETAIEMVAQVKGFELFRGFRNKPKGDLLALARAVSWISDLAAVARVQEAEINPMLVGADGCGVVLADALVRLGGVK